MSGNNIFRAMLWVTLGLSLSGVDYCQESYKFAPQAKIGTATATESPSPSPTADETDPTESPTATVSTSPTASPTSSSSAAVLGDPFFSSLVEAGKASEKAEAAPNTAQVNSRGASSKAGNWLGRIYNDEEIQGRSLDSDNDGYTDKLESDLGSNPNDPSSVPSAPTVTQLSKRVGANNPWHIDSDGDGITDGAELASRSNPNDAKSKPAFDSDGDTLSDEFEANSGINGQNIDTDADNLRDDVELSISSDPLSNDTDKDGILDGKEVELGSDPVIPESDPSQSFAKKYVR